MEESFIDYVEKRLPRPDDRSLFLELWKAFEEGGKENVRRFLQNMLTQLEVA
ncbi:MAG: hypothetical protein QXE79_01065 [Candidatus Bathyarchaeia archaeon]